jgi:hypothetical protein
LMNATLARQCLRVRDRHKPRVTRTGRMV